MNKQDKRIGDAIRQARERCGMSAKSVADEIGMNPVVYSRVELGSRPCRATELKAISDVIRIPANKLLMGSEAPDATRYVRNAGMALSMARMALRECAVAVLEATEAVTADGSVDMNGTILQTPEDVMKYLSNQLAQRPQRDLHMPAGIERMIRKQLISVAKSVSITRS